MKPKPEKLEMNSEKKFSNESHASPKKDETTSRESKATKRNPNPEPFGHRMGNWLKVRDTPDATYYENVC